MAFASSCGDFSRVFHEDHEDIMGYRNRGTPKSSGYVYLDMEVS